LGVFTSREYDVLTVNGEPPGGRCDAAPTLVPGTLAAGPGKLWVALSTVFENPTHSEQHFRPTEVLLADGEGGLYRLEMIGSDEDDNPPVYYGRDAWRRCFESNLHAVSPGKSVRYVLFFTVPLKSFGGLHLRVGGIDVGPGAPRARSLPESRH